MSAALKAVEMTELVIPFLLFDGGRSMIGRTGSMSMTMRNAQEKAGRSCMQGNIGHRMQTRGVGYDWEGGESGMDALTYDNLLARILFERNA